MGIGSTKRARRGAVKAMAKRIMAVLVVGVIIVTAMYAYDYVITNGRFAIAHVEFNGLSRIESDEFTRVLGDLEGQNLILAPLESYEARLEMHPRVESVSLRRILPNRVSCTVTERQPIALVYTGQFSEVDAAGMIMEEDEYSALLDLPIITGVSPEDLTVGKQCEALSMRRALEALSLCKTLGGAFAQDISELRVTASGVTIRSLRNDCVLVLGEGEYEKRLRKYFLLKESLAQGGTARLIDLRFDDQVVVRGQI